MAALLNKQLVTANDMLTSFKHKPEDCKIADKTLISKVEMRTVRRMMTENCMGLTCYDKALESVGWAATIIPENKYREIKAKIINKKKLKDCVAAAKAAATSVERAARINKNTAAVVTAYNAVKVDVNHADCAPLTFDNPHYYEADDSWDDAKILRENAKHARLSHRYKTYKEVNNANITWLEATIGKDQWHELDQGEDYENIHTAKDILEYLEKQSQHDVPIDIKKEMELFRSNPNVSMGVASYFRRQNEIKNKLKDTDKPISEATMKRVALGHFNKIDHLQGAVKKWRRDKDPNGTETFNNLRDWFSSENRIDRTNKQILNTMGNSAQEVKKLDTIEEAQKEQGSALLAVVNAVNTLTDKVDEISNIKSETTTTQPTEKNDDILVKLLAAVETQCKPAPAPKKEESKMSKLVTLLSDIAKKNNNNGGSGGNRGGNGSGGGRRPKVHRQNPRYKCYCSTHGVNPSHHSDKCTNPGKHHNKEATYEDRKGGSKLNLHKWHAATAGDRVDYSD